jgi:hypothetical protein
MATDSAGNYFPRMKPVPHFQRLAGIVIGLALSLSLGGCAQKRVDVEIDPATYALNGYSLHAGYWVDRLRLNLGAFSLDVPEEVHGKEGLEVTFHGYGLKAQYFPFSEGFPYARRSGFFLGLDGGVAKRLVRDPDAGEASYRNLYGGGAEAGWRFQSRQGFYITPWLGISGAANGEPVMVGGRSFGKRDYVIFPAVHIGMLF